MSNVNKRNVRNLNPVVGKSKGVMSESKEMRTMSITRALVTLKKLKEDISSFGKSGELLSFTYCERNGVKVAVYPSDVSVEEAPKIIDANYTSIQDKIKEYLRIKSAIAVANATTKVNFRDKKYTIYELISYKELIDSECEIYKRIEHSYRQALGHKSKGESTFESERIKRQDEMLKANKSLSEIEKFMKGDVVKYDVYSPLTLSEVMEKIQELSNITADIDMTLSEVNASTSIKY